MSLKAEIEIWVKALEYFDAADYTQSLAQFDKIADSSRILFNVGLIHANMGQHQTAIVYYDQAQRLDQYFALSFFQCGVSFFHVQNYEAAAQHFQDAYRHLRENAAIDYEQIGLKFKLYSATILFNQALSYFRMNQTDQGLRLLEQARLEKMTPEHDIIDQAMASFGRDLNVFSLPNGMLFRPSDLKVKNLKAKNYLGKAKLVAATSPVDAFVGFSGIGAKAATSPAASSPTSSNDRKRQSPPLHSRSASTPNAVISTTRNDVPNVPPLKLTKKKSSVDLRSGAKTSFPSRPLAPSDPNINTKLPRINTDVYRPLHPQPHYTPASASFPPQNSKTVPTVSTPMPPTPPDSDSGRNNLFVDRRDTVGTTLGYLAYPYPPKRDTDFMDDLVSEYSTITVESLPRPAPFPPISTRQPYMQGQPIDRVTNWANNQRHTAPQLPEPSMRYRNPSAPPSRQPSMGTLRRYTNRRVDDMQRLRSGSLDDHLSPTLASNQTLDDLLNVRTGDMLSFRLKLHFKDDIRGMSLDADTPWPEFYARLQSKFGISNMSLKYKDEDGTFVTIVDEDDWDSAIDAARENCRSGRLDGKLDIWIVEGSTRRDA